MSGGAPGGPPARRGASGYSRLVRWLKIALPVLGLALLSTIFLLPRDSGFDGGVVRNSADLLALGQGLTVSRPRISGATEAGEPFVVQAERATPDGPDPSEVELDGVTAEFAQAEGREIRLAADVGRLRPRAQTLSLQGAVRIETSDGYLVLTERLEADLKAGEVVAPGPVEASGPQGSIAAGAFRGRRATAQGDAPALGGPSPGDYLEFDGGVRVIWRPARPDDAPAE